MITVNLLRAVFREERETRRWDRSADRANERIRAKQPLFVAAGIVPLVTANQRRALIEDAHARIEAERVQKADEDRRAGAEFREHVRQRVTPEEFTALDDRKFRLDNDRLFWGSILHELDKKTESPTPDPPRVRRRVQLPLFVESRADGDVPVAIDGRFTLPQEVADAVAARAAGEDEPGDEPCQDCGWKPVGRFNMALTANVHPLFCPSLRAKLLGLEEGCADCKGRTGPCDAHRARAHACARDGCIPGPPRHWYMSGEACQRCGISMKAAPYARPQAA
jgi:hypothetical protein